MPKVARAAGLWSPLAWYPGLAAVQAGLIAKTRLTLRLLATRLKAGAELRGRLQKVGV